jgi:LuxR family maltose regulon positive regulatory protein
MTMSFLLHESPSDFEASEIGDSGCNTRSKPVRRRNDGLIILEEKLRIPEVGEIVRRPRLYELLDRSAGQFAATIISGRAGTGKTTLAADFAARQQHALWYSIEPADSEWEVFSTYFLSGLLRPNAKSVKTPGPSASETVNQADVTEFLDHCFRRLDRTRGQTPSLIVLDNIHHLFDADWFAEFFNLVLFSLIPNLHLLMICRSRPPAPLWRMRSKQVLNVIDESVLEFTADETVEICRLKGIPEDAADSAHRRSYGRISKLIEMLDKTPHRSR